MRVIVTTLFSVLAIGQLTSPCVAADPKPPLTSFKDCDKCPEMVVIPPGEFKMGSPADETLRSTTGTEDPYHTVSISRSFAIGKFEVTWDEWEACVAAGGCGSYVPPDRGWGRGRRPVILISWEDAKLFAAWLGETTGHTYRLPSEAEWEYAARAGTDTPFSTGPTITSDLANFNGKYSYNGSATGEHRNRTTPVGSFPANAFGLHDVHGNVMEFVEDCGNLSYEGAPTDGSAWTSGDCKWINTRGGNFGSRPSAIRSAVRNRYPRNGKRDRIGFRVVRELRQ